MLKRDGNKRVVITIALLLLCLLVPKTVQAGPGIVPGSTVGGDLLNAKGDLGWPVEELTPTTKIPGEYSFFVGTYPLVTQYKINNGPWKNLEKASREFYTGRLSDKVTYAKVGHLSDGTLVDLQIRHELPLSGSGTIGAYRWGISRDNTAVISSGGFNQDNVITYIFLEHDTTKPISHLKGHMTLGHALEGNDLMLSKDSTDKMFVPPADMINGIQFKGSVLKYRTYEDPLSYENDFYNLTTNGKGDRDSGDPTLLTNYGILLFQSNDNGEVRIGKKNVPAGTTQYGTAFILTSNFPAKVTAQEPTKTGLINETANGTVNYEIHQPLPNQLAGFYIEQLKVTDQLSSKLLADQAQVIVKDATGTDWTDYFTTTVDGSGLLTSEMKAGAYQTVMAQQKYGLTFSISVPINTQAFTEDDFVKLAGDNYFKYEHGKASTVIDEGTIFEERHETDVATSHTSWPAKVTVRGDETTKLVKTGDDIELPFEWNEIDSDAKIGLYYELNGVSTAIKTNLANPNPLTWTADKVTISADKLTAGDNEIKIYAKNSKGGTSNVLMIKVQVQTRVLAKYVDSIGDEIATAVPKWGLPNQDYTTEQKTIEGFVLLGAPPANANGKFGMQEIVVTYTYQANFSFKANDADFGAVAIQTHAVTHSPVKNTKLSFTDFGNNDWHVTLEIKDYLTKNGAGTDPLLADLKFKKKDGTSVELSKGASQKIYSKESANRGDYEVEWDSSKKEGLQLVSKPGVIVGDYSGTLLWTVTDGL